MKTNGRANFKITNNLVERSTAQLTSNVDQSTTISDISIYKNAKLYAELKRIAGYKNVSVTDEYKLLSKEAWKK